MLPQLHMSKSFQRAGFHRMRVGLLPTVPALTLLYSQCAAFSLCLAILNSKKIILQNNLSWSVKHFKVEGNCFMLIWSWGKNAVWWKASSGRWIGFNIKMSIRIGWTNICTYFRKHAQMEHPSMHISSKYTNVIADYQALVMLPIALCPEKL